MTVEDLIEELRQLPPTATVVARIWGNERPAASWKRYEMAPGADRGGGLQSRRSAPSARRIGTMRRPFKPITHEQHERRDLAVALKGGRMEWMLLTPREASYITDTGGAKEGTANAAILAVLQKRLNRLTGDLELSSAELQQVKAAAQHYHDGAERAFRAVLEAARRHGLTV
jgi:hypothetical protein